MNVLICSQFGEAQVAEVYKILMRKKVTPILFERYRKDQFITYRYGEDQILATLQLGGKKYVLDSDTFPAVWYRPKPIIRSEIPGESSNINERFCAFEWKHILHSLDLFLKKSKWINKVGCNHRVTNKAYQLKLAQEVGLSIPQTVISNDFNEVLNLFQLNNRVIYKTLSSFFTVTHMIYTNEIYREQLCKHHEAIAMAPGIFQNLINKDHELRVTVIGDFIFTVRINSKSHKKAQIDWRREPLVNLYEEGCLSQDTQNKLLTFHKLTGLIYAAYDFVVDADGNEIFLECNPGGQWLWLENKLKINISEMMANELIRFV
jgi:glutathione synthase/RimK-type ligase-like ATP-grasp enzyme